MKRLVGALLIVGVLSGMSGCNTMAGAGKDVERTGEKIQDAAKK